MKIDFLENSRLHQLFFTFQKSFSDFVLNNQIQYDDFIALNQRKSVDYQSSFGCFEGEELVGFILNSTGLWNGEPCAYQTSIGVIPEKRRQGIAEKLLQKSINHYKQKGIRQFLLECITTNSPALEFYKKAGYSPVRELNCFMKSKNSPLPPYRLEHDLIFEEKHHIKREKMLEYSEFIPAWQNSLDTIEHYFMKLKILRVLCGKHEAGYGIMDQQAGDILQIVIYPEFRKQKIGTAVLDELIQYQKHPMIKIFNIDSNAKIYTTFLMDCGFMPFISQYEMLLKL